MRRRRQATRPRLAHRKLEFRRRGPSLAEMKVRLLILWRGGELWEKFSRAQRESRKNRLLELERNEFVPLLRRRLLLPRERLEYDSLRAQLHRERQSTH